MIVFNENRERCGGLGFGNDDHEIYEMDENLELGPGLGDANANEVNLRVCD
jgi:hypothetical protein